MSSKNATTVPASSAPRAIESNPLQMLERGIRPQATTPRHRKSAAIGNLFFEYAQNVPTLRGIVSSGFQVAEYLESKGLISLDRASNRYEWKGEPLSKSAFLQMLRPASRGAQLSASP